MRIELRSPKRIVTHRVLDEMPTASATVVVSAVDIPVGRPTQVVEKVADKRAVIFTGTDGSRTRAVLINPPFLRVVNRGKLLLVDDVASPIPDWLDYRG